MKNGAGTALKRVSCVLVGLVTVALLLTFGQVMYRPFDSITLIWLIASAGVLACVIVALLWTVAKPLWRGAGFDDVERLFWVAFLALPVCGWLMYAVIWNLMEAYGN